VPIPPEPLTLHPGDPLSTRTHVLRPPAVNGVVSWTIETKRHRGYISVCALSPDGKKIATGGLDGTIRVWDTETGEFVRALVGHNSYVYGLAWSPDGSALASAGAFDGTARIWDSATGMPLRVLQKGHKGYTHHVAWSRDGKYLVVAGGQSGFLTLWDVTKPDPVKTTETGKPITGLSAGVDPKLFAVSGTGMGVQVWDVRDGKTPLVMVVPEQNATSVAWSADGKWIAGGSATKTFVWDAEDGKEKHVLDTAGNSLAYDPTGASLAVSTGQAVKVWTGFDKEPRVLPLAPAVSLAWSPDGAGVYATTGAIVRWQPLDVKQPVRDIDAAADGIVQLTPGRPLITGVGTLTPQLWDTQTGKLIASLEGHTGGVTAAAWSRDGKVLATASTDKTIRLWDATGKAVRTLNGHEGPVLCVAWADGKTLASGSADKTARIWQTGADAGKTARTHKGPVTAVAWSKDGKLVASGDNQRVVIVGAPTDGDKAQSLTATHAVQSLAWAPGGKTLAVGIENGNVEVFTLQGGKLAQSLEHNGSPPSVTSLAWAPDGNTLLSGRGNHTSQVWSPNVVKELFSLQSMAPVTHAAWSSSGSSMVVSESDRAVRVFEFPSGQLRACVIADRKQVAIVSAVGNYRVPDEAGCELVYVVQTAKGQETLSLKDGVAKYKFRNAALAAGILDK
jgi:WD40 repeat protein